MEIKSANLLCPSVKLLDFPLCPLSFTELPAEIIFVDILIGVRGKLGDSIESTFIRTNGYVAKYEINRWVPPKIYVQSLVNPAFIALCLTI